MKRAFRCCLKLNMPFYAVRCGRKPGVYTTWYVLSRGRSKTSRDAGTDSGTIIFGIIRGMCVTPGRQAGTARCRDRAGIASSGPCGCRNSN